MKSSTVAAPQIIAAPGIHLTPGCLHRFQDSVRVTDPSILAIMTLSTAVFTMKIEKLTCPKVPSVNRASRHALRTSQADMDVHDRKLTDPDIVSKFSDGRWNTSMARSRRTDQAGHCRDARKHEDHNQDQMTDHQIRQTSHKPADHLQRRRKSPPP